ncbi:MAG: hypothetical protein RIS47_1616 [Bacteroidota bacterium]|jgi:CBS domain containing-hemolysin-like protein
MINSTIVIVVSLVFSAFFSGMEIAFLTANRLRIELERQKGSISAPHIAFFLSHPREYIATMLVGNNIALVVYGIFMGDVLHPFFQQFTSSEIGITLLQTLFSTILILLTAEYLPKNVFRSAPNNALNFFAIPVRLFYFIFYPLSTVAVYISKGIIRGLLKIEINEVHEQVVFGKIDIDNLITESQNTDHTSKEPLPEVKLFQNAMEFSEIIVRECMVPRNEIEAIEVASSISVLEKMFAETGFSRIPVYEDSIDNIIGYAHHLQMFSHPRNIRAIVKSLSIVPETMSAKKLLKKLMAQQKTIAVVVDEFGGTAGLVTVEDLLEEIFGEIEDEHDEIEFLEEKISEKQFIFSGRLEIDYINEKYKLELPDDEEYETIAGFILYHHGRIPAQGEVVICGDYRFDILKAENPRIELIKMTIEE